MIEICFCAVFCSLLPHILSLSPLPCGHLKSKDFNSFMLSPPGFASYLGVLSKVPGVPITARKLPLHKFGSQLYKALLLTSKFNNPSLFFSIPDTGINLLLVVTTSVNHWFYLLGISVF